LYFGDARQQSLPAISWELGVLGKRFPGWQVVTKRSRELAECDLAYRSFIGLQMVVLLQGSWVCVVGFHRRSSVERGAACL
jgi:hypothetical protein